MPVSMKCICTVSERLMRVEKCHTLTAKVRTAAITSNAPPSTQLSGKLGSYSHIALVVSTVAILVMWLMKATFVRLITWAKHLWNGGECPLGLWDNFRLTEVDSHQWTTLEVNDTCGHSQSSCRSCCCLRHYWGWQCITGNILLSDCLSYRWTVCGNFALEVFVLVMSTRSKSPTTYISRFSPSCPPEMHLNPTMADRIVQLPVQLQSGSSIQWAVMPRNPLLIVSAVHASQVMDTLHGAAYADEGESLNFSFTSDVHWTLKNSLSSLRWFTNWLCI